MKRLVLMLLVMCLTIVAHAQTTSLTVDCQNPGWLSVLIEPKDQVTLTNLKVTGKLNADDIFFIGELSTKGVLHRVDLSEVKMIGCTRMNSDEGSSYSTIKDDEFSGHWFADKFNFNITKKIRTSIKYLSLPRSCKYKYQTSSPNIFTGVTQNFSNAIDTLVFDPINYKYADGNILGKNFKHLFLGENVDSIPQDKDYYSLSYTDSLLSLHFDGKVKYLGRKAFFGCSNLRNVNWNDFKDSITYIGKAAFWETNWVVDSLYLPPLISTWDTDWLLYKKNAHIFVGENITFITGYRKRRLPALILHLASKTPPRISLENSFSKLTVYVPHGCVDTYKASEYWSDSDFTILEEPSYLERIELDQHSLTLDVGETATLTATPVPEDAADVDIHWRSSDETVATVSDEGVVKAVASGKAYVSVVSGDIKDSCLVTVKTHVTGVRIEPSSVDFDKLGQTKQLEAVVLPENATDKSVTWKSGNEQVCNVTSSGHVTALGVGTTVVMATTNDGGIPASCVITVKDASTRIDEKKLDDAKSTLYNLNGQRLFRPSSGIIIVRSKDGKVKKEVVVGR